MTAEELSLRASRREARNLTPLSLRGLSAGEPVAISYLKKKQKTRLLRRFAPRNDSVGRLPRLNAGGVQARNDKKDEVASLLAMALRVL